VPGMSGMVRFRPALFLASLCLCRDAPRVSKVGSALHFQYCPIGCDPLRSPIDRLPESRTGLICSLQQH
jgi:hypothetical protein